MRKFIEDTNDLYEITSDGRVISYNKYPGGHELKAHPIGDGYKAVMIKYKNGKFRMRYVHRLVAEAFIPNPDNLPIINHKDENKLNNNVDNLEWCTQKYNCQYSVKKDNKGKKHNKYASTKQTIVKQGSGTPKRVALLDDNYEIERVFFSIRDAARFICPDNENSAYVMINRVCHKHNGHVTACGKKWLFISDEVYLKYINEHPEWLDENNMRHSKLIVKENVEKAIIRYNPKTGETKRDLELVRITKKIENPYSVELF